MKNGLKFKIAMKDVKQLDPSALAVLANIRMYTTESNTTKYRTSKCIAEDLNLSEVQVKREISALSKAEVFKLTLVSHIYEGKRYNKNKYDFKPLSEMFVLVDDSIFNIDLKEGAKYKAKAIGLLIKFKTLAYDNGNVILMGKGRDKKWLCDTCGMTYTAFNRIFMLLVNNGLITYENGKLTLKGDLFLDNSKLGRRNRAVKLRRARSKEMNISMIKGLYQSNTPTGKVLRYMLPKAKYPYAAALAIIKGLNKPEKVNEVMVNDYTFMMF